MSLIWDDILPGEDAVTLRQRFNDFLNSLADFANDESSQSRWEEDGAYFIRPVLDKPVRVSRFEVEAALDIPAIEGEIEVSRDVRITPDKDLHIDKLATGGDPDVALFDQHGTLTGSRELDIDSLSVADNFRVEADGKVFIDNLAETLPVPLIVDTDGRIRTDLTIDTYTVTFIINMLAGMDFDGEVWLSKQGWLSVETIAANTAVFTDVADGVYHYSIISNSPAFDNMQGTVVVSGGNETISRTPTSSIGIDPVDTPMGKGSSYIKEGTSANMDIAKPVMVVEREVNFDIQLVDPAANKTAEVIARKAKDGEALTLNAEGGFVMDGETGDVLTTEAKGAWAQLKVMDVSDNSTPVYKWVVVMDSGDWVLDNPE